MGDERVDNWKQLDTTPVNEDGTVVSVYRVPDVKGGSSRRDALFHS